VEGRADEPQRGVKRLWGRLEPVRSKSRSSAPNASRWSRVGRGRYVPRSFSRRAE
jgi:hypothetical protein